MVRDEKNTSIYIAYDDSEPFDSAVPEKNLLVAILLSAMSDLDRPGEASRKAQEYFLDPDDGYIFSFNSICNHLAIDPLMILRITGLKGSKEQAEIPSSAKV